MGNKINDPIARLMGLRYKSHPWHGLEVGDNAPEIVTAFIEMVPTDTVKYELDKVSGYIRIDRPQKYSTVVPALYGFIPQIQPAMTLLCAAYILWTAWSVWRSGEEPARGGSGAFFGGIAMQFLNAGVILCAVTSFSVFILPHHDDARVIALFAFAIAAAGFVSACCWAAFGAALEKFFRARRRLLNGAMALLLVWCALSQLAALAR